MRKVFSDRTKDPRVSTAEGFFDHVPVEDHWADVIIIAQAFHWCPDYEKAAQEFNRVLKSGGTLAMIWNLEDRYGAPLLTPTLS
jgi:nuclear pore complex protein Nup133